MNIFEVITIIPNESLPKKVKLNGMPRELSFSQEELQSLKNLSDLGEMFSFTEDNNENEIARSR